jgi:hypothetical protein
MLRGFAWWLRPAAWPALPDAVRRRVRALACLAIAAQVVFVVGWIIAGALEPGYSPVRSYVSELGRRGAAHPGYSMCRSWSGERGSSPSESPWRWR